MRAFLSQCFALHRRATWAAGLLAAVVVALASAVRPPVWRAQADIFVAEPYTFERLASPFTALPDAEASVRGLEEELLSTERMVALAKGSGLLERLEQGQSWPYRAWHALRETLSGELTEKDRLDALVGTLRKKVTVEVKGRRVVLASQWSDPKTAVQLVQLQLDALTRARGEVELTVLAQANAAIDDRLKVVRAENAARRAEVEQALAAADRAGAVANVSHQLDALQESTRREQDLLVDVTDAHVGFDVAKRANELRFVVLSPPRPPRHPASAPLWQQLLAALVAIALSALAAPVLLTLGARRLLSAAQVEDTLGLKVLARLPAAGVAAPAGSRPLQAAAAALALVSGAAAGLSDGSLLAAVLPCGAVLVGFLVWTRPLKWPVLGLLLAGLMLDDPTDRPYAGMWQSPLYLPGKLLFTNVALFTGFELCVYALLAVMLVRSVRGSTLDPLEPQAPRPLRAAVLLSLGTVLWLVALGLLRGGEFRTGLWQFRYLLFLPGAALLVMRALEFPKDLGKVLGVVVAGSLVKAVMGAYFIYAVARPNGLIPPHTTGHNDTVLFVAAVFTPLALLWERRRRRLVALALFWLPLVALAIKLNDRRIAYVELLIVSLTLFLVSPWNQTKRAVTRLVLVLAPVVALYVVAGWNTSGGRLFAPVQKVKTIVAPPKGTEETSNTDRDTENYDLLRSWEGHKALGQGFGFRFTEFRPLNDFKPSNYGQIGHNSILWLLWIGGLLGFFGVMLYVGVSVFFAGRTLPLVGVPEERAALTVALAVLVTYMNQAFGDMGTQSYAIDLLVAVAVAVVGQLATRHGAWLQPVAALRHPPGAAA